MSFKAELSVAGRTYKIYTCRSHFSQTIGANGRPASGVKGGRMSFLLEGTDDDALWDWIGDPVKKQDGVVTFYRIDQDSKFKEIEFKGAYAMALAESFCTEGEVQELSAALEELIAMDHEGESRDSARYRLTEVNKETVRYHRRSGIAYCMYLLISAEKIEVDGVEHENRWA